MKKSLLILSILFLLNACSFENSKDTGKVGEKSAEISANEKIVLQTLQKLKNEGKTIVLITHNPDLAKFADRTLILQHGVLK
ncbi:ABC transporter, ATP-binding protein [Campylobacter jejuni subsp. doylei 269.97]|uniref:ABC transporter, ATP-binding protein n=1 Tax=Campylobacter jejuni subsp. doylei (strain ATCC BAA-1458 / RM4099 / 269.97) TaxID=360109 RepID=A7H608_CAMJD|nr:ABC transporter, ATP-binding protein [Campylobacter jejuni subsp. doylei 269.97]